MSFFNFAPSTFQTFLAYWFRRTCSPDVSFVPVCPPDVSVVLMCPPDICCPPDRAELYATFAGRRRASAVLRVRCLPFVYLIGQPKCGTTDLRDRLRRHPQVASGGMLSAGHWWSRMRYPPPSPGRARAHCATPR